MGNKDGTEGAKVTEESMNEERKALGQRCREAREYLGFSQEQVATFLGVSRSALSLIESGQRKVDAMELKKLAGLYRQPIGYFTGERVEETVFGSEVSHLARKVSELSNEDRLELARFADFLKARRK